MWPHQEMLGMDRSFTTTLVLKKTKKRSTSADLKEQALQPALDVLMPRHGVSEHDQTHLVHGHLLVEAHVRPVHVH